MDAEKLETLLVGLLVDHPDASEINFTPDRLPHLEVDGELIEMPLGARTEPLTATHTQQIATALLGANSALHETLETTGSADCALGLSNGRRFRVNVFRARGNLSVVLRALASEIPTLEKLGVPPILESIPNLRNGLVLVTGSTGSGKSTTLAAIIDRINSTRAVHVVTLEDPIEFSHGIKKAVINQRELQTDFATFGDGLRAALRQAPKVILVGEMRDRQTVEIALKAAETGHLVLSTLHTIDAGQAINRLAGMFEVEERVMIRTRLAETLRFVVAQRLLPRAEGGRVAALEIMGSSLRVRELIVNGEHGDKTFNAAIADARPRGWQTFDQHVIEHLQQGRITEETARTYCSDAATIGREIDRLKSEKGESTSDIDDLEMLRPQRRFK